MGWNIWGPAGGAVWGAVNLWEVGPSCRGWALELHNPAPLPVCRCSVSQGVSNQP